MGRSCALIAAVGGLFLLGVVGFVVMLGGTIFVATSGIVESADAFLENTATGKNQEARSLLSAGYSESFSDSEFNQFVIDNELDQYENVFWNNRSVQNHSGNLEGTIKTKNGRSMQLKMSLVHEQGAWKISRIERPDFLQSNLIETSIVKKPSSATTTDITLQTDSLSEETPPKVAKPNSELTAKIESTQPTVLTVADIPNEKQSAKLAKKWTSEFCQGVSENNFGPFHSRTSTLLQQQVTLAEFTKTFQGFLDKSVDLDWVKNSAPEFEANPSLDADGVLRLAGWYPAAQRVNFEYRFIKEDGEWKPLTVGLSVAPEFPNTLPSITQLKKLAIETTQDFGKAIEKQDFTDFYSQLATDFKKQYPLAQFMKIFRSFLEKRADLSWIGSTGPSFSDAPTLNTDGVLKLVGGFDVDPPVNFKFVYFWETGQWRIISINVSIPPTDEDRKEVADTGSSTSER